MKQQVVFLVIFHLASIYLTGCKTYSLGDSHGTRIELEKKEYVILGPVRVEGKSRRKEITYDRILSAAREKYGVENADVINIKIDKVKNGKIFIINGYAIKYKQ